MYKYMVHADFMSTVFMTTSDKRPHQTRCRQIGTCTQYMQILCLYMYMVLIPHQVRCRQIGVKVATVKRSEYQSLFIQITVVRQYSDIWQRICVYCICTCMYIYMYIVQYSTVYVDSKSTFIIMQLHIVQQGKMQPESDIIFGFYHRYTCTYIYQRIRTNK